MLTRTNVVYAGANDGMLHGFRSGYFSAPNVYDNANNDGAEMVAYVPGYIVNTIQTTTAANNYSDPQYGHHFDVDAAPGTGDLFYGGAWHTWLVGGLGPGGNAIYALDITNPGEGGAMNFSEASASSTVLGEWSILNGVTKLELRQRCQSRDEPLRQQFRQDLRSPADTPFSQWQLGRRVWQRQQKCDRRWRHLRDARQSDERSHHVLLSEHPHRLPHTRPLQRDLLHHAPRISMGITLRTTCTRGTCWGISGAST